MPKDIFDAGRKAAFFESILNSLTTGIFVTDQDCIIRFINDAYASYLGLQRKDIIGRPITDFFPDARAPYVTATGTAEMGALRTIKGKRADRLIVVNRLPFKDENHVIGMLSQTLFGSREEFEAAMRRMKYLDQELAGSEKRIKSVLSPRHSLASILGSSAAVTEFRSQLLSYAHTDLPILITGATGSGKELAAGALHSESARREGHFVGINCASIPKDLFESELFGYAPGAFSGAHKDGKVGLIELADRGTLFLDEIGDTPLPAQAKLLRVLEERILHRLGSTRPRSVDFRLIAATNRDLKHMIAEGLFREDLYYRISPIVLNVPPLRERREDIPLLIEHMLRHMGKEDLRITDGVLQMLTAYHWPGNIRELRNVVARAVGLCKDAIIDIRLLPPELFSGRGSPVHAPEEAAQRTDLAATLADNELRLILRALQAEEGNVSRCAVKLGISRTALYGKLQKYGLKREKRFSAAQ